MGLLTSSIIVFLGAFLTYIGSNLKAKYKEYLSQISVLEKAKSLVEESSIDKRTKTRKIKIIEKTISRFRYSFRCYFRFIKDKKEFTSIVEQHKLNIDSLIEGFYIVNNKEKIINSMLIEFNDAKKNLKLLSTNHLNLVEKYLKNSLNEKAYYQKNFIDVMSNYIDILKEDCQLLNYDKINYNIKKISDLKKAFHFEVDSVNDLKKVITTCDNNIKKYEDDIKNIKGSLYYKIYRKIKNNNVSKEHIDCWNVIKKDINVFLKERVKNTDVILLSNMLMTIMTNLNKLDLQTDTCFEKSEELVKQI